MNKINSLTKLRNSNFKFIILILLLVFLLIFTGFVLLSHERISTKKSNFNAGSIIVNPPNTISNSPTTYKDNVQNDERKGNKSSAVSTLNSPETIPSFSVTISRANIDKQSLTIAANVSGVTSGTCSFSISKTDGGLAFKTTTTEQIEMSGQSAYCPPKILDGLRPNIIWYASVLVTNNGYKASAKWLGATLRT